MKTRNAWLCALALLLPLAAGAQETKLPVFFLRYEGGAGSEEIEAEEVEEEQVEPSSQRHKLTLRIKEQWSDQLATNLYTAVSRKLYYLDPGSYTYFYLNPDFQWELGERLAWRASLRSKWTHYEELDTSGLSKDLTSLLARSELTVKLLEELKLEPFLQGVFDLYRNEEKVQQTWAAGVSLESRLGAGWRLTGRYRAALRFPLGPESAVPERFNHEFGLNLSWDPNR